MSFSHPTTHSTPNPPCLRVKALKGAWQRRAAYIDKDTLLFSSKNSQAQKEKLQLKMKMRRSAEMLSCGWVWHGWKFRAYDMQLFLPILHIFLWIHPHSTPQLSLECQQPEAKRESCRDFFSQIILFIYFLFFVFCCLEGMVGVMVWKWMNMHGPQIKIKKIEKMLLVARDSHSLLCKHFLKTTKNLKKWFLRLFEFENNPLNLIKF